MQTRAAMERSRVERDDSVGNNKTHSGFTVATDTPISREIALHTHIYHKSRTAISPIPQTPSRLLLCPPGITVQSAARALLFPATPNSTFPPRPVHRVPHPVRHASKPGLALPQPRAAVPSSPTIPPVSAATSRTSTVRPQQPAAADPRTHRRGDEPGLLPARLLRDAPGPGA